MKKFYTITVHSGILFVYGANGLPHFVSARKNMSPSTRYANYSGFRIILRSRDGRRT